MSLTMSKRRRGSAGSLDSPEAIRAALDAAVKNSHSAEMAVLHLMDEYDIEWQVLKRLIEEKGLNISFSRVTWEQIAPLVGIQGYAYGLARVPKFELQRARIPKTLFRSIIEDINHNQVVYGPLREHANEESHSRFISPVFVRTVDLFRSSIIGTPETLLEGRIASSGRVEHHFCTINGLSLLFIEIKYKIGTPKERLNAVAQVIAEADACDYRNQGQQYYSPIYCALFDGESFRFFKYDHTLQPKFCAGAIGKKTEFLLADSQARPKRFIQDLRPVCEIIFFLLLTAHRDALTSQGERDTNEELKSAWERGAAAAQEVLNDCLDASKNEDRATADQLAELALAKLSSSIKELPPGAAPANDDLMEFYTDDEAPED